MTSSPLSRTRPLIGLMTPEATRKSVVLPAPFGPSSATTLASGTDKETSRSTTVSPYPAVTFSNSNNRLSS